MYVQDVLLAFVDGPEVLPSIEVQPRHHGLVVLIWIDVLKIVMDVPALFGVWSILKFGL